MRFADFLRTKSFLACSICATVFIFIAQPGTAAQQTGRIVGWGGQVVGADLDGGFIAVAGGDYHSLGLKEDGSIAAWGHNSDGRCDIPSPNAGFIAVAAGWDHSLGLRKECRYILRGDLNDDCKVGSYDFSLMARNWLIDCYTDPNNAACVRK